jgi:hypothetical protein
MVLFIFLVVYLRIYYFCQEIYIKYTLQIFYIYIGIIVINAIINIILLAVVEMDSITNLISSMEIGDNKIILKINQGKESSDLVQTQQEMETKAIESNKKLDSVDIENNKEYKCKEKNLNLLKDIHKRLLLADKSHFPSHFQKNCLPKIPEDVPVYGDKLVTFKPSSLLQNRNLPEMSIEIPKSRSMGKLTELYKAIDGADEAVQLYDSQFIKFNKVLSGIKNGTEEFYPNEAKPLMETYVDLVTKLSHQQKVMANEAINQLHKLDSNFSRNLYLVDNSDGNPAGAGTGTVASTRAGTDIGTGTSTSTGIGTRTAT